MMSKCMRQMIQAHIQTTPACATKSNSDLSKHRQPRKTSWLHANLMLLIDVSLGEPNKDDGNVALDFSMMVTSVTITTTTSGSGRRCTSHSIGPPVQIYDTHGVGPDESVYYLYKITNIILLSAQVRLLIFKSMHRAQLINSSLITHVKSAQYI